jgi:hypothetical protein
MKFDVQLKGQVETLEAVAPCFQSDRVRIIKRDDWFLESSEFDQCSNGGQVFPIADDILRLIHRVCLLFTGLASPFEIGYVQPYSDTGSPLRRALRSIQTINVYSSAGIQELRTLKGTQTLGAEAISRALDDQTIRIALSLIGEHGPQWPQIYDVVEFLGWKAIVNKGWATQREVKRVKRTANHHRHAGRPGRNPLPPNPPSLHDSATFVLGLLKKWITIPKADG